MNLYDYNYWMRGYLLGCGVNSWDELTTEQQLKVLPTHDEVVNEIMKNFGFKK